MAGAVARARRRNYMPRCRAGTLRPWVIGKERKAMSSLGVLAITATLIATGASAQGIYGGGGVSQPDAATIDRTSDTAHFTRIADSARVKDRAARSRGARSYASAPAERARGASAFDGDWSVLIQTRVG